MLATVKKGLKALLQDEGGQGMVEYGLIIGLVAVALVAVITGLNGSLASLFARVGTIMGNVR